MPAASAWWEAVRQFGAALSLNTELDALVSLQDIDSHRLTPEACPRDIARLIFDASATRDRFTQSGQMPEYLRERMQVLGMATG